MEEASMFQLSELATDASIFPGENREETLPPSLDDYSTPYDGFRLEEPAHQLPSSSLGGSSEDVPQESNPHPPPARQKASTPMEEIASSEFPFVGQMDLSCLTQSAAVPSSSSSLTQNSDDNESLSTETSHSSQYPSTSFAPDNIQKDRKRPRPEYVPKYLTKFEIRNLISPETVYACSYCPRIFLSLMAARMHRTTNCTKLISVKVLRKSID